MPLPIHFCFNNRKGLDFESDLLRIFKPKFYSNILRKQNKKDLRLIRFGIWRNLWYKIQQSRNRMDNSYIKTNWKFYGYFSPRNRIQWRKWSAENDKFESRSYLQVRKNTKKELLDRDNNYRKKEELKNKKSYLFNYFSMYNYILSKLFV